jgi:hypothetical protein
MGKRLFDDDVSFLNGKWVSDTRIFGRFTGDVREAYRLIACVAVPAGVYVIDASYEYHHLDIKDIKPVESLSTGCIVVFRLRQLDGPLPLISSMIRDSLDFTEPRIDDYLLPQFHGLHAKLLLAHRGKEEDGPHEFVIVSKQVVADHGIDPSIFKPEDPALPSRIWTEPLLARDDRGWSGYVRTVLSKARERRQ